MCYVSSRLLLVCCCASTVVTDASEPGVRVELFEEIPDRSWHFTPAEPSTTFSTAALAMVGVPLKYDEGGLRADRSNPFLVRATSDVSLPAGKYRLLLRAKNAARLSINGQLLIETDFLDSNADGHESVPELEDAIPDLCRLPPGHQQKVVMFNADRDVQHIALETIVGGKNLRAELGELFAAVSSDGEPFRLLAGANQLVLDEPTWQVYAEQQIGELNELNTRMRRQAGSTDDDYWQRRQIIAKEIAESWKPLVPNHPTYANPIDRILAAHFQGPSGGMRTEHIDDWAFLRRVSLDTAGVIPSLSEMAAFFDDEPTGRRSRAIDRLLADDRWADHWVAYWQDLLAENPGLVKPKLNNTGPFRWWIHESLLDNKPLDRFATELIMMRGSTYGGGPAGFAMATQNDVPMAAKAHIVAKAFLGIEIKCARCHDAPAHEVSQRDTFSFAAMLQREQVLVPASSTVPGDPDEQSLAVEINLRPGEAVAPDWPFADLAPPELPRGALRDDADWRERAAAIVTSPRNRRFAEVLVNRVWHRYLGWGIVDAVDDWEAGENRCPQLLEFLSHELISHGYDLKHIARLILGSHFYQQPPGDLTTPVADLPGGPGRRRMTAEQLVDSIAVAMGKPLGSEMLCLDPEGRRPIATFLNLGRPHRAWQMVALSNERDRPALSLPVAQGIVDVLKAFGWRESRQEPTSYRDHTANVLQPLILSNGVTTTRLTGLSDDSVMTEMALQDVTVEQFIDDVFRAVLSRLPSKDEMSALASVLSEGFEHRRLSVLPSNGRMHTDRRSVSWSNHLSPEATRIKLELERSILQGDPPTERLASSWRERAEDVVWALVNSPEFVFVP